MHRLLPASSCCPPQQQRGGATGQACALAPRLASNSEASCSSRCTQLAPAGRPPAWPGRHGRRLIMLASGVERRAGTAPAASASTPSLHQRPAAPAVAQLPPSSGGAAAPPTRHQPAAGAPGSDRGQRGLTAPGRARANTPPGAGSRPGMAPPQKRAASGRSTAPGPMSGGRGSSLLGEMFPDFDSWRDTLPPTTTSVSVAAAPSGGALPPAQLYQHPHALLAAAPDGGARGEGGAEEAPPSLLLQPAGGAQVTPLVLPPSPQDGGTGRASSPSSSPSPAAVAASSRRRWGKGSGGATSSAPAQGPAQEGPWSSPQGGVVLRDIDSLIHTVRYGAYVDAPASSVPALGRGRRAASWLPFRLPRLEELGGARRISHMVEALPSALPAPLDVQTGAPLDAPAAAPAVAYYAVNGNGSASAAGGGRRPRAAALQDLLSEAVGELADEEALTAPGAASSPSLSSMDLPTLPHVRRLHNRHTLVLQGPRPAGGTVRGLAKRVSGQGSGDGSAADSGQKRGRGRPKKQAAPAANEEESVGGEAEAALPLFDWQADGEEDGGYLPKGPSSKRGGTGVRSATVAADPAVLQGGVAALTQALWALEEHLAAPVGAEGDAARGRALVRVNRAVAVATQTYGVRWQQLVELAGQATDYLDGMSTALMLQALAATLPAPSMLGAAQQQAVSAALSALVMRVARLCDSMRPQALVVATLALVRMRVQSPQLALDLALAFSAAMPRVSAEQAAHFVWALPELGLERHRVPPGLGTPLLRRMEAVRGDLTPDTAALLLPALVRLGVNAPRLWVRTVYAEEVVARSLHEAWSPVQSLGVVQGLAALRAAWPEQSSIAPKLLRVLLAQLQPRLGELPGRRLAVLAMWLLRGKMSRLLLLRDWWQEYDAQALAKVEAGDVGVREAALMLRALAIMRHFPGWALPEACVKRLLVALPHTEPRHAVWLLHGVALLGVAGAPRITSADLELADDDNYGGSGATAAAEAAVVAAAKSKAMERAGAPTADATGAGAPRRAPADAAAELAPAPAPEPAPRDLAGLVQRLPPSPAPLRELLEEVEPGLVASGLLQGMAGPELVVLLRSFALLRHEPHPSFMRAWEEALLARSDDLAAGHWQRVGAVYAALGRGMGQHLAVAVVSRT